jgi:hypothetical protein
MFKLSLIGAVAIVGCAAMPASASSFDCGPHAHITYCEPNARGGTFCHCKCSQGYVRIGGGYQYAQGRGALRLPGCTAAGGTATAANNRPQGRACSVCADGLRRNVQVHIGQARQFQTYVDQAIAGYNNCKQKAVGDCSTGDILVRTLRNGCSGFNEEGAFHACIARIFGR